MTRPGSQDDGVAGSDGVEREARGVGIVEDARADFAKDPAARRRLPDGRLQPRDDVLQRRILLHRRRTLQTSRHRAGADVNVCIVQSRDDQAPVGIHDTSGGRGPGLQRSGSARRDDTFAGDRDRLGPRSIRDAGEYPRIDDEQ